jgi:pyruvate kinase
MRAKIVATIGPSSIEKAVLKKMLENGMGVIRINSSYGDIAQYDTILDNLKEVDGTGTVKRLFDIKSEELLPYCKQNKMDMIAISFTENTEQIARVREAVPDAFIISKIESVPGVQNYEAILEHSDGIMIARGDLSVAATIEKVPPLQKKFTKLALEKDKFVIAATEMLLSMVNKPTPTNAEASDVANAIFDGVHAVMLSEETAIGNYPAESVEFMKRVVIEAEKWCDTSECRI